jgi:hypothetical protein
MIKALTYEYEKLIVHLKEIFISLFTFSIGLE